MFQKTDDLRIRQVRPLIPPAILHEEIPISERASNVVAATRAAIANALKGQDPRLVVIAGAGHNPMWEKPADFDREVLEFLRG